MFIFKLVLFFQFSLFAEQKLNCTFTLVSAPFLTTVTDLNDQNEIGEYTQATYYTGQGAKVPNKVLDIAGELYSFELNEESSEKNMTVHVFEDLSAKVKNPQDTVLGEASGDCSIESLTSL